jgi:beta-lactamase regulating signal transducer with metallopeptidase domain
MTWLIDTLFATGALIAVVLVLRRPVSRWFGPGMAYALWALPLLRLIIPPLVLPEEQAPVAYVITEADVAAEQVATIVAETQGWEFGDIAVMLWLAGALAFIAWRAWGYVAMRRRLLSGARPVGEIGRIRLVETPAAPSPVAFGLADKVVALPPGFMASEDRTSRDLAIAHELEHHAGRDIAVNFAMQPLLALHWFNPLAWLGWRALRRDQEAACDARVPQRRDPCRLWPPDCKLCPRAKTLACHAAGLPGRWRKIDHPPFEEPDHGSTHPAPSLDGAPADRRRRAGAAADRVDHLCRVGCRCA